MIVAAQKRQTNIVEYVLYMWHIEDLLRSMNLDIHQVREKLLPGYQVDSHTKLVIEQWYTLLIKEMRENRLQSRGHLEELNEVIRELDFLHTSLLYLYRDEDYNRLFEAAREDLDTLAKKTKDADKGVVSTGLTALYGVMLLRLKRKTLYKETEEALSHISALFALLAARFRDMKEGRLELTGVAKN